LKSSGDFSLKMEMTNSELVNNITTHQKILQRWSEKLTLNQTEQFKNIKFAMGFVFGIYNEDLPNDIIGAFNEKGPNGEQAYSDMYAVFYRSGPIDVMLNSTHHCVTCLLHKGEYVLCEDYRDRMQHPDLGNKEDCFTNVNWT